MVGFATYFHVPPGHPVLQHPLYLKYNGYTTEQIASFNDGNGFKDLKEELQKITVTLDNMAILWYLRNLLGIYQELQS